MVDISTLLDAVWYMKHQIVIVAKLSQGLPWNVQSILTDENVKNRQKACYCELAISHYLFVWIVSSNNFFPSSQVSFIDRNMKRFMLKSIELGMTE